MRASQRAVAVAAAALLCGAALPLVAAHGDEPMNQDHGEAPPPPPPPPAGDDGAKQPSSYFRYGHYSGWIMAHIGLMVVSWVVVMPLAVMLSIARSRYHLPAQLLFHVVNGLGLFTGFVYNHATPDLYPNDAHHPIGWVATSFTVVWTLLSLYTAYGDFRRKRTAPASASYAPVPYEEAAAAAATPPATPPHGYTDRSPTSPPARWSDDSALGGSRQNSSDATWQKSEEDPASPLRDAEHGPHDTGDDGNGDDDDDDDDDEAPEKRGFLGHNRVDHFVSRQIRRFATPRASRVVRGSQIVLEKFLLLLGFLALSTGFVTLGGIFRAREVFSGLAHFIKGGIFVWYGLLTLGRWMGAFAEFGWAWNLRPAVPLVARWKTRIPSAEFTESFVIWLYGASNVFLEHLNGAGSKWEPQDFEHVSITILFFGGGLLGMVLESARIRSALNTNTAVQQHADVAAEDAARPSRFAADEPPAADPRARAARWREPESYRIPMNPMPAVVIMALGMMMSSHHQSSMVSAMMHVQWGSLFTAFALARAVTYVTMFLKPPTSHFPARPPSELVAAFCLSFGGLMFMMSARDVVTAIESNGLDAMTVFTITAGLSGLVIAWAVVCFAIKGWAVRKERAAAGQPLA